ncbi:unnamed protein product [Diplocarpon coronariae]
MPRPGGRVRIISRHGVEQRPGLHVGAGTSSAPAKAAPLSTGSSARRPWEEANPLGGRRGTPVGKSDLTSRPDGAKTSCVDDAAAIWSPEAQGSALDWPVPCSLLPATCS